MLLAWQSKSMPVMHIVFNNSTAVEYILLTASLLSVWLPAEGWIHGMLKLDYVKKIFSSFRWTRKGSAKPPFLVLLQISRAWRQVWQKYLKVLIVPGKSLHTFMKNFTVWVTDHWSSCSESLWRYPKDICPQSWVTCSRGLVWAGRFDQMTSSGPL